MVGFGNNYECDEPARLLELDGTENKARLGAKAVLSVSLAAEKGRRKSVGLPVYQYIGGVNAWPPSRPAPAYRPTETRAGLAGHEITR